jgi:hypothetical protein
MKQSSPAALSFIVALLCAGLAGCTTTTTSPSASKPAPTAPSAAQNTAAITPPPAPVIPAPVIQAPPPPAPEPFIAPELITPAKVSPEALAVVERFTQSVDASTLPHELADTTGFPAAMASLEPGMAAPKIDATGIDGEQPPAKGLTGDGTSTDLIERDWTGLVLVPINTSLAKAYVSEVRLLKVEAHPLKDGRVRVWTRVRNIGRSTLPAEVACSFRMSSETTPPTPLFYSLQVPAGAYRDVFFVSPDGELATYTVLVRSVGMARERR